VSNRPGILYIVATPIGNLADFSPRAVEVLKQVDVIAAEDTRHSRKLLVHYGINRPMVSCHEHNEFEQAQVFRDQLLQGQSIALISDAGTPLVSDPGYRIVKEAIGHGIQVSPIPGPCAAIAALSVSGLPSNRFLFVGFPPAKHKARIDLLQSLTAEVATLIFYESPHRLTETLADMNTVFGASRTATMARELTKMHESIMSGSLAQLIEAVQTDNTWQMGEMVLLLEGATAEPRDQSTLAIEQVLRPLLEELSLKQAVQLATRITGARKNDVYQLAVALSRD